MPGRDPGGCLMTILLGIGGAVLAGFLGQQLGWYRAGEGAGFIAAIVGAVLILFALPAGRPPDEQLERCIAVRGGRGALAARARALIVSPTLEGEDGHDPTTGLALSAGARADARAMPATAQHSPSSPSRAASGTRLDVTATGEVDAGCPTSCGSRAGVPTQAATAAERDAPECGAYGAGARGAGAGRDRRPRHPDADACSLEPDYRDDENRAARGLTGYQRNQPR